jgi:hypothetical protein
MMDRAYQSARNDRPEGGNPHGGRFVRQLVKRVTKLLASFTWNLAGVSAVAFLGQRYIAGFDVRGPFLLMSPLLGVFLFSLALTFFQNPARQPEGKVRPKDEELIQATIADFGFGTVEVQQQRHGKELRIALLTSDGSTYDLPANWDSLSENAREFAVIHKLLKSRETWLSIQAGRWPATLFGILGMAAAGVNLWTILGYHALCGLWVAYATIVGREKALIQMDLKAFRITRDLSAAIAYINSDEVGVALMVSADHRIATLRRSANRLGIA